MNEFLINGQMIKLPEIYEGRSILVRDTFNMNFLNDVNNPKKINYDTVIGIGDINSIKAISKVFDDLKYKITKCNGVERLLYIEMYKKLLKNVKSAVLVKQDICVANKQDEIDNSDEEFSFSTIDTQPIEDLENSNVVVLNSDGTPYVDSSSYQNESSNITSTEQDGFSDYISDPSQHIGNDNNLVEQSYNVEKESLLDRLKKISSEGPIFIDEQRLEDKNLTVNNAISMKKINFGSLNVNPEKLNFVKKENRILEMGKEKYQIFKSAVNKFVEKTSSIKDVVQNTKFKVKSYLQCKYDQIQSINFNDDFLAEMPKSISKGISYGAKKLSLKNKEKEESINQLLTLRETLIRDHLLKEDEVESVKVA